MGCGVTKPPIQRDQKDRTWWQIANRNQESKIVTQIYKCMVLIHLCRTPPPPTRATIRCIKKFYRCMVLIHLCRTPPPPTRAFFSGMTIGNLNIELLPLLKRRADLWWACSARPPTTQTETTSRHEKSTPFWVASIDKLSCRKSALSATSLYKNGVDSPLPDSTPTDACFLCHFIILLPCRGSKIVLHISFIDQYYSVPRRTNTRTSSLDAEEISVRTKDSPARRQRNEISMRTMNCAEPANYGLCRARVPL